ncbi:DUF4270 family protein [Taibaiella lutea]|nr:DUF4270 family protein [Taibaiella lutea]
MLRYLNKIQKASLLLIGLMVLIASCKKAVVNYGQQALTDDPNVIYMDTMSVDLSTLQRDSFVTSADNLFKVGIHEDSVFGKYEATAYMQVGIPVNTISGLNNCTYDSIVFITKFSGASYGDTTEPFTLNINRLSQQIKPDVTPIGYNVDALTYDATPLGTALLTNTRPLQQKELTVRLSNSFGTQLFGMLNRNSDTTSNSDKFNAFFNGFALTGKGVNNQSIYYFQNIGVNGGTVMRMYYTVNGASPVPGYMDFPISPTTYQFNGYKYDKTGTLLSLFTPNKWQAIPSAQTGNRVYLHSNSGLYPVLNIPSLFSLKELHPYIKVVKAELDIYPSLQNYGPNTYYTLPPTLGLQTVNIDSKLIGNWVNEIGVTPAVIQNGDLVIDNINHIETKYTYDITEYVNSTLQNGIFNQAPLVLRPLNEIIENRLILNNAIGNKSVKLKLYVLGL